MIGIKAIGSYLPPENIDNLARANDYQTDTGFINQKLGFLKLPRKHADMETSDLCIEAFNNLKSNINLVNSKIDCVIVCTQTPDNLGLPHTSAIVHRKLQLHDRVAAFDISLGCSGYVYGINIIRSFMEANDLRNGLLFTADPYSKILDHTDRNTELLFGDGATCTLFTKRPLFSIQKTKFATDGKGEKAISVDPQTGKLSMIGKDVYIFVMKRVPTQIEECLQANGLTHDKIDMYLLHQGSKFIVDNLIKKMRLPEHKTPFEAWHTGNTVSSSIPLLLKDMLQNNLQYILLSGFGVGLSWATTIIKKE